MKKTRFAHFNHYRITHFVNAYCICFFRTQGRSRFGAISLLVVFYLAIYAFFGISKTIIYLIYGLITFGLLIIFPDYEFPFILIGTLLMIINPLEHFERYLNKQLNENAFVPIQLTFVSKYNTYLSYRRDMKSALNLPQMQKLFTNQKIQTSSTSNFCYHHRYYNFCFYFTN